MLVGVFFKGEFYRMKRLLSVLLLSGTLAITGCTPSVDVEDVNETATEQQAEISQGTITMLDTEGNDLFNKEVSFVDGELLSDIMENNFDVVSEGGFITSIDGHEQSTEDNIFLVYEINEEMVMTGIEETEIFDGDSIVWKLEQF